MLDLLNYKRQADDEVIFYDGILYIICCDKETHIDGCALQPAEYSVKAVCLAAEYDEPWTLADIARIYPKVCKVIYDDALKGAVYSYGNHGHEKNAEKWEKVGETVGYA
jgi:hypothetical protein